MLDAKKNNLASFMYNGKKSIANKKKALKYFDKALKLDPKNEEAIYHLAKLKLKSSDYKKSKELNKRLQSICSNFCNKSQKLKEEIENLSKK
mgnify:CR=1 FL=1